MKWKATLVDSSLNKVFSEWGAENNVAEAGKRQEVKGREMEIEIERDRETETEKETERNRDSERETKTEIKV